MRVLVLSFSSNEVNEDSFVPNKIGLTISCVEECERKLKKLGNEVEHIYINKKNIKKCLACGKRGWGICLEEHKCTQNDNFNEIYEYMSDFDAYIFITPVYFWEMSESAKTFFDILNHFLKTKMVEKILVTKLNFENQKEVIGKAMSFGG